MSDVQFQESRELNAILENEDEITANALEFHARVVMVHHLARTIQAVLLDDPEYAFAKS